MNKIKNETAQNKKLQHRTREWAEEQPQRATNTIIIKFDGPPAKHKRFNIFNRCIYALRMYNMPHIIHYHQEWSPHRHLVRILAFFCFCFFYFANHIGLELTLLFFRVCNKCRNNSFHSAFKAHTNAQRIPAKIPALYNTHNRSNKFRFSY